MPSTITPPEIDRHRISDGNNGHRPPTDKRTGGNGEGDGASSSPSAAISCSSSP
jgi:cytochrome c oxidase subunit III